MSLAFTYTQSRLNKMSQLCQECKLEQTGEKHTADSFLTASRSSYAQAVRLAREEKSQHVTSSVELRQPRIPVGNSKNVVMAAVVGIERADAVVEDAAAAVVVLKRYSDGGGWQEDH